MPLSSDPELLAFDVGAALDAAQAATGDRVLSFVEFTGQAFNVVHVDDAILALYEDEEHLHDHYGTVLSHINMDFLERDTYEKTLLPNAGRVRTIVTEMEELTLVRYFHGDDGLYVALDPDAPVAGLADAIDAVADR